MGFIGSIVSAVVSVVVSVVQIIVQIVEVIIELIMTLLGFGGSTTTQVIEYFEVHNYPFYDDIDNKNPLLNVIKDSVLGDKDIAAQLIYAGTFGSYKGDIQKFMNYISNGDYFEGFPAIESYITYPDYTELTDAITLLEGVPATPENAYTQALTTADWIKYWLQENKAYSYHNNTLIATIAVTTSPAANSSTFTNTPGSSSFLLTITDEIATSDSTSTTREWKVDFSDIVYNVLLDTYSIAVFTDEGDSGELPYTVPSKPLGLHYISPYYINSAPTVQYLFVYLVGEGTYPDLDNPQNQININAAVLQAVPAIPLRVNNTDYTSRPAAEVTQINELSALVGLNANDILDAIKNDPDAPSAGDLDHIYINFGIRMWDTSQMGITYLFTLCENLFPAQGVTKGIYDNTQSGDVKPANNIIITAGDYKYLFQFSYLSYEFTTLADINADTGSAENGYYYSDMSRFDANNILYLPYYVSSGKGTYNVGFKSDTLTEVANFLSGNGTVNPGTTTGEATNWMQVTQRMAYNNTTPVLHDADNTVSALKFLTPDLVYENNGSGILRHVESATEATTSGQSITYFRAIESGLEAYTMAAPIASLRVEDGDSGKFKMVKFNLGNRDDLMVPFVHNFIKYLSNKTVTQLFLAGSHASIYVAHYEVIVQRTGGFGGLFAILIIVIIVVVAIFVAPAFFGAGTVGFGAGGSLGLTGAMAPTLAGSGFFSALGIITSSAGNVLWGATFMNLAINFAINQVIQFAMTAAFGEDSMIGQIAGMALSAVAFSSIQYDYATGSVNINFDSLGGFDVGEFFKSYEWDWSDTFKALSAGMDLAGSLLEYRAEGALESLQLDSAQIKKRNDARMLDLTTKETALRELEESLFGDNVGVDTFYSLMQVERTGTTPLIMAANMYSYYNNYTQVMYGDFNQTAFLDRKVISELGNDTI